MLSTIQCKNTDSLPQAGNDKKKLQEHNCKSKWDGLYSTDTFSNKSHQHGLIKVTHHEHSTSKINRQKRMVPVWIIR